MPPPAITAAVYFTIGGTSVMTAADTIVPAMNTAGVAEFESLDQARNDTRLIG